MSSASTRKTELFLPNGMNRNRSDVAPLESWWTQRNMRSNNGKLEQVDTKKVAQQIQLGHKYDVVHIGSLATSNMRRTICFALTQKSAYYLGSTGTLTQMTWDGLPAVFETAPGYVRWDVARYNQNAFFVNPLNSVFYTNGSTVSAIGGNCPAGSFVEVFYDHLFVACPVSRDGAHQDLKIEWSHLKQFDLFGRTVTNEAGSYIFTEYEEHSAGHRGITGMRKLGNRLMVYTADTVYGVDYVGLPHIINVNPVVTGCGNTIKHAVVSTENAHFFVCFKTRQFYQLTAGGVSPIGDDIQEFFFPLIEDEATTASPEMWGYHDARNNEIWWLYDTRTTSTSITKPNFTNAVVYNYMTKKWFVAVTEDLHAFCETQGFTTRFDEIEGTFDELTGHTIQGLGALLSTTNKRLWGGRFGRVYEKTELLTDAVVVASAQLESRDFIDGSWTTVKERDLIALAAGWAKSGGVEIEFSTREKLDDEIVWQPFGVYTKDKNDGRITGRKHQGRIFRFRLTVAKSGEASTRTTAAVADVTTNIFNGFNGPVSAIDVASDGKIYVAGWFTEYQGDTCNGICRLNPNGTLDKTFDAGVGFTTSSFYLPPTELKAVSDGVWCGLSLSRMHSITTGGLVFDRLRFNGAVTAPLLKLNASGILAIEQTALLNGAVDDALGGFCVLGTNLFYVCLRSSGDPDDEGMRVVKTTESTGSVTDSVLFKTEISYGSSLDAINRIADIKSYNGLLFASLPAYNYDEDKTITDVFDHTLTSILTSLSGQEKLGAFVFNTSLDFQWTWISGQFEGATTQANKASVGRICIADKVAYVDYTATTSNEGSWPKSLTFQHKGLYRLKLPEADVPVNPEPQDPKWISIPVYSHPYDGAQPDTLQTKTEVYTVGFDATLFNLAIPFVGAGIIISPSTSTGTYRRLEILYGTNVLVDAETIPTIFPFGGRSRNFVLDGSSDTITVNTEIYYDELGGDVLFGDVPSLGFLRILMAALSVSGTDGMPQEGLNWNANGWNLHKTDTTDSGFVQPVPLLTYKDNTLEQVYVTGVSTAYGEDILLSPVNAIDSTGQLTAFQLPPIFSFWQTNWGATITAQILCGALNLTKDTLYLGGVMTQIGNVAAGHLIAVDPITGKVKFTYTIEGNLAETLTTGQASLNFVLHGIELNIYNQAAVE